MSIHSHRLSLSICLISILVLSLSAKNLPYQTQPEENSAPLLASEVPHVRYWDSDNSFNLPTTIVHTVQDVTKVPVRENPLIAPVLYHNIVFGRTGNVYNRDIYNFEHDLAFFKRNYLIIDFQELIDIKEHRKEIHSDTTIITFDDGDLSIYAIVFPMLKVLQLKATFFIIPNFIGEVGYMSWEQVREMSDYRTPQGVKLFSFGSHSLTHRPLGDLSKEEIVLEMKESRRILQEKTGEPIITIALPFGSGAGTAKIMESAQECGYLTVRTSQPGASTIDTIDLMNIKTFNVENYSTDVLVQKMLKLTGR